MISKKDDVVLTTKTIVESNRLRSFFGLLINRYLQSCWIKARIDFLVCPVANLHDKDIITREIVSLATEGVQVCSFLFMDKKSSLVKKLTLPAKSKGSSSSGSGFIPLGARSGTPDASGNAGVKREAGSNLVGLAAKRARLDPKSTAIGPAPRKELDWQSMAIEVTLLDIFDTLQEAEKAGKNKQIEQLMCGVIKRLNDNKFKSPDPFLTSLLCYLCRCKANYFQYDSVLEGLFCLMRRPAPLVPPKLPLSVAAQPKTSSVLLSLTSHVIVTVILPRSDWPDLVVRAYLDDSLADRYWVDRPECSRLVSLAESAFDTVKPSSGLLSLLQSNYDSVNKAVLSETTSTANISINHGNNSPMPQIEDRSDAVLDDSLAINEENPVGSLLEQSMEISLNTSEIRRSSSDQMLKQLQNQPSFIGGHCKFDRISIKEMTIETLRDVWLRRAEAITKSLVKTMQNCCGYREVRIAAAQKLDSWIQNPKLQKTCVELMLFVCVNSKELSDGDQEVITNLLKLRLLKSKSLANNFCIAIRELLQQNEFYLKLIVRSTINNEFASITHRSPNNMFILSQCFHHDQIRFTKCLADVFYDFLIDKDDHTKNLRILLREIVKNQRKFTRILFLEKPDYYTKDGWPSEHERNLCLKIIQESPVNEEILYKICLVGALPNLSLHFSQAIDLVDQMIKKVAAACSDGKFFFFDSPSSIKITKLELIELLFSCCTYKVPDLSSLPTGYVAPSLAVTTWYWRVIVILLIFGAHNIETVGKMLWNDYPTIRLLMQMLMIEDYNFPPLSDSVNGMSGEQIKLKDLQVSELEKQEILELENHLAAATTKQIISENNSHLLAQLMRCDPKGPARRPTPAAIEHIKLINQQYQLGLRLSKSREPDFLLEIINSQGASHSLSWLVNLIQKNEGSLSVLPIQCLCEFLIHQLEKQQDLSNFDAISIGNDEQSNIFNERRVNEMKERLRNVLWSDNRELDQNFRETLIYFAKRLQAPVAQDRRIVTMALNVLTTNNLYELSNDFWLDNIDKLSNFLCVETELCNILLKSSGQGDKLLIQWGDTAAVLDSGFVSACLLLLAFDQFKGSSEYNALYSSLFPTSASIAEAFLIDTTEKVDFIPISIRSRLLFSGDELIVNNVLSFMEDQEIVESVEYFGLPIRNVSKLLKILDEICSSDDRRLIFEKLTDIQIKNLPKFVDAYRLSGAENGLIYLEFFRKNIEGTTICGIVKSESEPMEIDEKSSVIAESVKSNPFKSDKMENYVHFLFDDDVKEFDLDLFNKLIFELPLNPTLGTKTVALLCLICRRKEFLRLVDQNLDRFCLLFAVLHKFCPEFKNFLKILRESNSVLERLDKNIKYLIDGMTDAQDVEKKNKKIETHETPNSQLNYIMGKLRTQKSSDVGSKTDLSDCIQVIFGPTSPDELSLSKQLLSIIPHEIPMEILNDICSLLLESHRNDLRSQNVIDFIAAVVDLPRLWVGRDLKLPRHHKAENILNLSPEKIKVLLEYSTDCFRNLRDSDKSDDLFKSKSFQVALKTCRNLLLSCLKEDDRDFVKSLVLWMKEQSAIPENE
uniref:DUF3677 domain-containing protein n=1 Tax=Romanomermis culicivorax TaxID=13658 RepID=A0A915IFF1_ROMCU